MALKRALSFSRSGARHGQWMVLALLMLLLVIAMFFLPRPVFALSPWAQTTAYPSSIAAESCVTDSGYLYCVGGGTSLLNAVSGSHFAPLSSDGIGIWASTTPYPVPAAGLSCVASSGYIFCVGGTSGLASTSLSSAYYAPVSSSGIGVWVQTTSYPEAAAGLSCAASSGFIYCVGGGSNELATPSSSAFFATLSPSGIGTWTKTTSYPTIDAGLSCVTYSGSIYCVGGATSLNTAIQKTYFASVSSSGIGEWTRSTNYPLALAELSCVTDSNAVYCIGGGSRGGVSSAVYSASLSSTGMGKWSPHPAYPTRDLSLSCVAAGGYAYCIGGASRPSSALNSAYYAPFSSLSQVVQATGTTTDGGATPTGGGIQPGALSPLVVVAFLLIVAVGVASSGNLFRRLPGQVKEPKQGAVPSVRRHLYGVLVAVGTFAMTLAFFLPWVALGASGGAGFTLQGIYGLVYALVSGGSLGYVTIGPLGGAESMVVIIVLLIPFPASLATGVLALAYRKMALLAGVLSLLTGSLWAVGLSLLGILTQSNQASFLGALLSNASPSYGEYVLMVGGIVILAGRSRARPAGGEGQDLHETMPNPGKRLRNLHLPSSPCSLQLDSPEEKSALRASPIV